MLNCSGPPHPRLIPGKDNDDDNDDGDNDDDDDDDYDNDDDDDIYVMMQCVFVCHEKSSLPEARSESPNRPCRP